jgi:hypothetical protein
VEEKTVRRRELRVTPEKKKRKLLVPFLAGLGVAALVPVIGSTLATQITLNSDNPIEFGQGYKITTACDTTIVVTPASLFSTDQFILTTVTLSDIDAACEGKSLKLSYVAGGTQVPIASAHVYHVDPDAGSVVFEVSGTVPSDTVDAFTVESS